MYGRPDECIQTEAQSIFINNGMNWTLVPAPAAASSIELVGANDGWMVGGSSILRLMSGT